MIFRNRVVDKGQLKVNCLGFTHYGTARTASGADRLKELGFRYTAGISISVDDLMIPPKSASRSSRRKLRY